jgi:hypothetical protein
MVDEQIYHLGLLEDRNKRGAFTLYCDDVRREDSGKGMFIGVYSEDMLVPEFPVFLPNFVIYTAVWTTHDRPFEKLIFRVLRDEELISEEPFDVGVAQQRIAEAKTDVVEILDPSLRQKIVRIARFSPFVVEKESIIRVRVETEDGEMRTSGLRIRQAKMD